jgi:hypothetical protein
MRNYGSWPVREVAELQPSPRSLDRPLIETGHVLALGWDGRKNAARTYRTPVHLLCETEGPRGEARTRPTTLRKGLAQGVYGTAIDATSHSAAAPRSRESSVLGWCERSLAATIS